MWERRATLELFPYIFEIVESFFAGDPFRGSHRALGEAFPGFSVVTEIDPIDGGFQHNLVHAHDFAFAKGNDFQIFIPAAGFADCVLERDGRA